MMELYDNGRMSEMDKEQLTIQEAVFLAISNYVDDPVENIIPTTVFKYILDKDLTRIKEIQHLRDCEKSRQDYEYLWPCFVDVTNNASNKKLYRKFIMATSGLDDDSKIFKFEYINLAFVDRTRNFNSLNPFIYNLEDKEFYYYSIIPDYSIKYFQDIQKRCADENINAVFTEYDKIQEIGSVVNDGKERDNEQQNKEREQRGEDVQK